MTDKSLVVRPSMSAVDQWQWFLYLRRGGERPDAAYRHGRYVTYNVLACRCAPCRAAGSDYNRHQRTRRKEAA